MKALLLWPYLRLFLALCWRQGILRSTRFRFWWQFMVIALRKPKLLFDYLVALGAGEHFFMFRHEVKVQLQSQLDTLKYQKEQKQLVLSA